MQSGHRIPAVDQITYIFSKGSVCCCMLIENFSFSREPREVLLHSPRPIPVIVRIHVPGSAAIHPSAGPAPAPAGHRRKRREPGLAYGLHL